MFHSLSLIAGLWRRFLETEYNECLKLLLIKLRVQYRCVHYTVQYIRQTQTYVCLSMIIIFQSSVTTTLEFTFITNCYVIMTSIAALIYNTMFLFANGSQRVFTFTKLEIEMLNPEPSHDMHECASNCRTTQWFCFSILSAHFCVWTHAHQEWPFKLDMCLLIHNV